MERINQAYAGLFTTFVARKRVRFEDGLNFWGGSTVADPNGEFLAARRTLRNVARAEIDLNELHRTRSRLPCCATSAPVLARELSRILENSEQGMR